MKRREFLKKGALLGGGLLGLPWILPLKSAGAAFGAVEERGPDLAVVRGLHPGEIVRRVIEELGGMSRFIRPGEVVVVKPNIAWDKRPEQAANTNPELVAEVIKMCLEAGAKVVKVFDRTCNNARRSYRNSGIAEAAKEAGAKVSFVHEKRFDGVPIPEGKRLKSWPIYRDAIKADRIINLPLLKHHSLCRLTMGIKNLMGLLGGNRGKIHNHFPVKIVDINTVLRADLTILDAVRVLRRQGPQGGSLADVERMDTVLAGADPVAVDAYGAMLFGLKPEELDYLVEAYERGLGEIDLKKLRISEVNLS